MLFPKLIAEFVGVFTLCFIGIGSIAANQLTGGDVGMVGIALAHGLAIGCMVAATMAVSGGQLNPAVSIALFTTGRMKASETVLYIVSQCLAGFIAVVLLKLAFPADILAAVGMGVPAPGPGVTTLGVFVMEFVLTFFLMFVIMGVAVDGRGAKEAAIFIGLTITLGILCGGAVSGGSINPARHFGPAILSGNSAFIGQIWIYCLAPVLGAILAAWVYQLGILTPTTKSPETDE